MYIAYVINVDLAVSPSMVSASRLRLGPTNLRGKATKW